MNKLSSFTPQECQVSVVIVNWNTRELLAGCLVSLSDQQLGDEVEIWVVDNGSTDGSVEMVRTRFPQVRLIENKENQGFAVANNQAMQKASGRYLLLLNSDTVVEPGAIQALVAFMDAHERAGAAGARLLNTDGSLQPSCHPMLTPGREFWRLLFLDLIWPRATYAMDRWSTRSPRRVEVIKGACLMLRRSAIDQVGLLDEVYFMYTEEVDLCYRLSTAGWQLWWVPAATVIHFDGQSSRQMAERMYVQLYRSKVQFYRKFGGERKARRFKRMVRLAYAPRWMVSTLGAPFSNRLGVQRSTVRQLLAELPGM